MKKTILAVTAALMVPMGVLAGGFDLNSMNLSSLKASQPEAVEMSMPVPQEIAGFNKSPQYPRCRAGYDHKAAVQSPWRAPLRADGR